ncbi:MAG: MarR family transcriptional regulator [Anaerolineales bacterium]|nr:MarR family transcriptional regulator [Anaerolineales bacterium]
MTNFPPHAQDRSLDAIRQMLGEDGGSSLYGLQILRRIVAINGAYEALLADELEDVGLTPHRWRVLLRIWIEEQTGGAGIHPTQLSRAQQLSKNTISEHLRALEELGLVEREVDTEDRRQFKIHLTDVGRTLVQRTAPGHIRYLNTLLDGLDKSEVLAIEESLCKLHAGLLTKLQRSLCAVQS